ncbi:aldo/keto reductase [Amycolatopsis jiangsuensis]|uniref:Aryl-alcohol dehydrogenase-like predicted oxidoreductase n=1 Tax=Amycolatopsis jiangsuensis TaxID=1181879 RepID=A0A840J0X7_9PSEU|nr:aldo/keto reductase [Amycolatopsis jiangsuensis]MBB4687730.1 aryl-alcohol dehydrogenase-like predicted oxidoreductase [Amycolatopsis jiangsuensis]
MTARDSSAPGGTANLAGRQVARIGFGAMQLERASAAHEDRLAVLRQAIDGGVNHIDTAHFYGAGVCNDLIREALAPYPQDLVVVTKIGADNKPDGSLELRQRPEELRAQIEANLTGLGVDRLDVVNLRRGDAAPGLVAEGEQIVDIDSQLAELIALRDAGKIGAIGLSHVSADQLRHALPARIVCVQNAYSVLDRSGEPVLDLCREHGVAWVPFFPLGSAFDLGWDVTGHPVVTGIAADLGVTPAQVALAWLLAHDEHTLLIPGTANPAHLAENLAVRDVRLPAAAIDALDHIAVTP